MSTQSAGSGTELDNLYWTLSVRAGDLLAATPGVVQAGKQMETAGKQAAAAAQGATQAMQDQAAALRDVAGGAATASKASQDATVSFTRHEAATHSLNTGLRATRTGLVQIALQSTQTNAAFGRLIEGMLLIGAGSTAVLGVAAAIAVLAKGYELLTAQSRAAAANLAAVNDILDKRKEARAPVVTEYAQLNVELEKQAELQQKIAAIRTLQNQPTFAKAAGFGGAQVDPQQLTDLLAQEAQIAIQIAEAQRGVFTERGNSRVSALDTLNQAVGNGTASAADLATRRDVIAQINALLEQTNISTRERLTLKAALASATTVELDQAQKQLSVQRQLKDLALAAQDALAGLTTNLADNAVAALQRFDDQTKRLIEDAKAANARPGASPIDITEIAKQRAIARLGAQGAVVTAQTQDFLKPLQDQLSAAGEAGSLPDQLKILDAIKAQIVAQQQLLTTSNDAHLNDQAILLLHTQLLDIDKQRVTVTKSIFDTELQKATTNTDAVAQAALAKVKTLEDAARKAAQDLARGIDDAVHAAVQLGEAFGGIDVNLGNVLVGVADLATKIPDVSQQLADLSSGKKDAQGNPVATVGGVVSSLAGIVGGAASLFSGLSSLLGGQSAAEKAYQQTLLQNTDAIRKLTDRVGELGAVNIAGSTIAAAQKVIGARGQIIRDFADHSHDEPGISVTPEQLGIDEQAYKQALAENHISAQQLNDLATSLGLTLDFTTTNTQKLDDAFRQLGDALAATQLAQFTQDFTGQLSLLQDSFKAFDITDPLDQLKALQALVSNTDGSSGVSAFETALEKLPPEVADALRSQLGQALGTNPNGVGSPALQAALAGNDLNTAEGRAAALANLQALFLRLNLGPTQGGLQASDLGGLTGQEFEQAILQLIDLINQTNSASGSTSNVSQTQTITEVTAGRMISTLLTIATVLQETLPTLVTQAGQIADLLQAAFGASPTVSAPPMPAGGYLATSSAAGGSVTVGALTVHVTPPAGVTDAASFGAAAGAAAVATIKSLNTALGRDLKLRQLLAGQAGG